MVNKRFPDLSGAVCTYPVSFAPSSGQCRNCCVSIGVYRLRLHTRLFIVDLWTACADVAVDDDD